MISTYIIVVAEESSHTVLIPGPAKLLEGLPHLLLTLTVGVDLSGIEGVALEDY